MLQGRGLKQSGVRIRVGATIFLFSIQTDKEAHPAAYLSIGHQGSFLGVERLRRDADNSTPLNADVKNEMSYKSNHLPPPPVCRPRMERANFTLF
jgi:hypothetical protein